MLGDIKVYFSDYFDIEEDVIESYGAVNISLINDLPLFIDAARPCYRRAKQPTAHIEKYD